MSKDGFIAINRFGMGANIQDTQNIYRDPKSWLRSQINASAAQKELGKVSNGMKSSADLTEQIIKLKQAKQSEKLKIIKQSREHLKEELRRRVVHGITTDNPFIERLVLFWSNHFTISVKGKPFLAGIAGAYEREVIRPYVFRKFSDMLLAVVQHPAMLVYLDNQGSIGPNSKAGKRRKRGLNENLAREIMELHTLGVNGGYTQKDVIALAKIITGWTVKPPMLPGKPGYMFIDRMHEPGPQTLLGKTYNQKGETQGIQALIDLSKHPSTARFIATKLARHFISDNPPESAITKLEHAFYSSGGDLMTVSRTLIDLPEVWKDPLSKFKTPYELILSSLRMLGAKEEDIDIDKLAPSFALLDHVPFNAASPAGWGDTESHWLSSNSLMNRIEWVHALTQIIPFRGNPNDVAKIVIGPVADADTMLWISRAPSAKDGLALVMASPEFQRR